MRNGIAYQQVPLVPLTGGIGSGLWPTPTAQTYKQDVNDSGEYARRRLDSGQQINIALAVKLWPTPTQRDYRSGKHKKPRDGHVDCLTDHVWISEGKPIVGTLNPQWVEWLMGYPTGWTEIEPLATPSSRKSQNGSGGKS
jgi:DNA (cytosine-5)-methyltransferase 1